MIIDSQVHSYEAETPQRGAHHAATWPAHVTGDEMVAALDARGIDGAILVSVYSMYRYDPTYAISVQRAHPGRFGLVKPIDPDDAAAAEIVADWKKSPGAVGIRIMMRKDMGYGADHPGIASILHAAGQHDMPVNIICWGTLDVARTLIERHANTRFAIDHLGIQQPDHPPAPADAWAELPTVLELARFQNAVVKVSGVCAMSRQSYPYDDIWDPLARIFDAWGIERCLWGTDWTRTSSFIDYRQATDAFRLTERLTESERATLMGGACAKFYSWTPQR